MSVWQKQKKKKKEDKIAFKKWEKKGGLFFF